MTGKSAKTKSSSSATKAKQQPPNSTKQAYLVLYNSVSAVLWLTVLGRTALTCLLADYGKVYSTTGTFTRWTQTLACLEILHAALGIVRSPLFTTFMQVASRVIIVWGIVNNFPQTCGTSVAYSTMLIAWSVTEVVRYSYFTLNLSTGQVPDWVLWLRYNLFYVLYPMGISSEAWQVYLASIPAERNWGVEWGWFFKGLLLLYVPGSYVLYTHMITQRRKVMGGKRKP